MKARNGRFLELRGQAEKVAREKADPSSEDLAALSSDQMQRMLHELNVHQIELEMQNDELLRTQENLESLRARYFDLYDLAPVGYVTIDDKGIILEANSKAASLLGATREALTRKPITRFILPEDQDVYYLQRRQRIEPKKSQVCLLRMVKGDETVFWARLETAAAPGGSGGSLFRVVISDITESKLAEAALQQTRDTLEACVMERTEELKKANEELQAEIRERTQLGEELKKAHDELEVRIQERTTELNTTVARLEQLNRELEEFAFIASHDLQEPLRKIETFSDLVKKRCGLLLDKTSRDYLDRVVKSAGHMRHLIGDLLKLSRITTKLNPFQRIDLFRIAKEVTEVFEAPLKETGGRIEIDRMPVIEADETQLRQLFQNLIGNALKFRDQNKPLIRVYGRVADQGFYEIFVKDNGIGFDPGFAENIFIPFERLHGHSEYEGTGMGLAICRKIVERHGGTIRAESEPGKGSTFIIKLPLKKIEMEEK